MENYLYFAEADVETGGDSASEAVTVPASSYLFADPLSLTVTNFYFKSVLGSDYGMQKVALTHTSAKNKEVIKGVLACMNAHPSKGGFVIVANANAAALTTGTEFSNALQGFVTAVAITQDVVGLQGGNGTVRFPDFGVGAAEPTDISATALSVNTHYQSIAAATAMTIPSAAAGKKGDWITVFYDVAAGNTNAHTYTTTTDTAFSLGSTIRTAGGSHADRIPRADIAVAADNVITITGATNGDGGQGTYLKFVNLTGAALGWAAEVHVTAQGTGVTAGTAAFS